MCIPRHSVQSGTEAPEGSCDASRLLESVMKTIGSPALSSTFPSAQLAALPSRANSVHLLFRSRQGRHESLSGTSVFPRVFSVTTSFPFSCVKGRSAGSLLTLEGSSRGAVTVAGAKGPVARATALPPVQSTDGEHARKRARPLSCTRLWKQP